MTAGIIAITMAGLGARFRNAGYDRPKYKIEVLGKPLFDWSLLGLTAFASAGWRFRFAALRSDEAGGFIRERCSALRIEAEHILELDALTDGQATTALLLMEAVPDASPVAVFNIDTFVRPGAINPASIPARASGWIPCFPGPGEGWSFTRTDDEGRVVEVREKQRVSSHATIGFYWFASAGLYRRTYASYFAGGRGEEKGERYIAPMYNQLIAEGRRVEILDIPFSDVGMLGTPEQVREFAASPPAAARASIAAGHGEPRSP
jgi:NDP-sugar pyrophosphorylase family protein